MICSIIPTKWTICARNSFFSPRCLELVFKWISSSISQSRYLKLYLKTSPLIIAAADKVVSVTLISHENYRASRHKQSARMKHFKSHSAEEARVTQARTVGTSSYNSVTFTNTNLNSQSNPIIISTTQHPSQISIIHEVRSSPKNPSDMVSPADSFHSVVSNFPSSENLDGKVNLAFAGSNAEVNNHHQPPNQSHPPPPR